MSNLTVYYTNTASTTLTTANKLSITKGTDNTNVTQVYNLVGISGINWGMPRSQGNTGAWASTSTIGAPDGTGFFLEASTLNLVGQTLSAGNWSANIRLNTGYTNGTQTGTLTGCEIHVRAYKYNSGVYTPIIDMSLVNQTINSVITTFALSGSTSTGTKFNSGDFLYIDWPIKIGANANNDANLNIRLNRLSTNSTGDSNAQVVTPGYGITRTITPVTAALLATGTRTAPATTTLRATNTRTMPATASLQQTVRTIPATAAFLAAKTRSMTATAALLSTPTRSMSATTTLLSTQKRTATASAAFLAALTRSIPASVVLLQTRKRIVSASTALRGTGARNVPATTALRATNTRTMPISAALFAARSRTISGNTVSLVYRLNRTMPTTAALIARQSRTIPTTVTLTDTIETNATVYVRSGTADILLRSGTADVYVRLR